MIAITGRVFPYIGELHKTRKEATIAKWKTCPGGMEMSPVFEVRLTVRLLIKNK